MTKQLDIKEYVQQEKERLRQADIEPLHIVIIDPTNHDAGNQLYLHGILKDFSSLGWKTTVESVTTQEEYEAARLKAQQYKGIDAIFTLRPAREGLTLRDSDISPLYDAEGIHPNALVLPATVRGILDYLDACGFEYQGKRAVVIGRSKHVGLPMARELLKRNMTVTVCHSKTNDQDKYRLCSDVDLVICAAGHPKVLNRMATDMDAIVVDVGINEVNGKIVGDFQEDLNFCRNGWSTPVPGGVGQLTRLGLIKNCIDLTRRKP